MQPLRLAADRKPVSSRCLTGVPATRSRSISTKPPRRAGAERLMAAIVAADSDAEQIGHQLD